MDARGARRSPNRKDAVSNPSRNHAPVPNATALIYGYLQYLINATCPDNAVYAGAITVTVPREPRYLRAPFSTYKTPPSAGFTDGAVSTLPIPMTPLPPPNWSRVRSPILPPAAIR